MESVKPQKKIRSTAYPAMALERAVEDIRKLSNNLGVGEFDRDSVAKALGYSGVSGASASKIASLVHFGLLRRQGDKYAQSDLAERIMRPLEEDGSDKKAALVEAATHPRLFNDLLNAYAGQRVPSMLPNILIRQYAISPKVAVDVAKIFESTMKFVNLLRDDMTLTSMGDKDQQDPSAHGKEPETNLNMTPKNDAAFVPVDLPGGIKILFPASMSLSLGTGQFASGISELKKNVETLVKASESEGSNT